VETGCQGGQGSPRAVAPGGWMDNIIILTTVLQLPTVFSTVTCCTDL